MFFLQRFLSVRNGFSHIRPLGAWTASSQFLNDHQLTSNEVSTALRPFFFAVHPDRFWAYPAEKDINENSLKQLNEHLEVYKTGPGHDQTSSRLFKFYLRNSDAEVPSLATGHKDLTLIQINLRTQDDINSAVDTILSSCKLSTEYLKRIGKTPTPQDNSTHVRTIRSNVKSSSPKETEDEFWARHSFVNTFREQMDKAYYAESLRSHAKETLSKWLLKNSDDARKKNQESKATREDILKLKAELKEQLNLESIIWDSNWSINHCRGCLLSLKALTQQHQLDMKSLTGRTLVFGLITGITYDGHVFLSTEDVRQNWLKMIRSINSFDGLVLQVPSAEKYLSHVLNDIKVSHRKFKPTLLIQSYLNQLFKLTTSIEDFKARNDLPFSQSLGNYKLVVESDAGPLMLSPTGQFIAPASSVPSLLLEFIKCHLNQAEELIKIYDQTKFLEDQYIFRSLIDLNLEGIEKDDNVTPDLMIKCIQRLLDSKHSLAPMLRETRIRVSKYYAVEDSGEICIPWNFST